MLQKSVTRCYLSVYAYNLCSNGESILVLCILASLSLVYYSLPSLTMTQYMRCGVDDNALNVV